jgi:prophage tail gpP-like protein
MDVWIQGRRIPPPIAWSVTRDMYNLGAQFSMTFRPLPPSVALDADVVMALGGARILRGIVEDIGTSDDRSHSEQVVSGRDTAALVIDEAAEFIVYAEYDLLRLAKEMAEPLDVVLSNAENRALIRGRGRKTAAAGEPIFSRRADVQWRSLIGQSRGDVLRFFLGAAGLIAWTTGDGTTLCIGKPNDRQRPQFRFGPHNVLSIRRNRSIADRHSELVGFRQPVGFRNEGLRTTIRDQSGDFRRRKRAYRLVSQARTAQELRRLLQAEFDRARQTADTIDLDVAGHGQPLTSTDAPTLFALDTIAELKFPALGITGHYLITGVRLNASRSGDRASLSLVPRGTPIMP